MGAGAVDVEAQGGGVGDLLDVNVDGAGDAGDAGGKLEGEGVVGFDVAAGDLDIDGRGEAEVEDLADDVGRLGEEDTVGEFTVEALAQGADVVPSRAVFFGVEGDEDFAVGGADGGGVAEGEVHPAGGQADVVEDRNEFIGGNDFADDVFYLVKNALRLLDTHARGSAHVKAELAGVDEREEIASEQRHECGAREDADERDGGGGFAVI